MIVIGTDVVERYFAARAGHRGIRAARAQYDAWRAIAEKAQWKRPEDVKKATTPMDGPTGKVCLNLKPTKKLIIKVEQKDASGSSSSSSENFVAEKDGKLVIPVPGPCK